ncbi:Protein kinase domain [Legionella pneumophila]|uniref:protein kinase n=1 Tax=Legionella pneumophila TaxID=446 RepID=UPI000770A2C7|nr:protein kinase [Legionella pneumophila]CZG38952.1 Protein kinase domain [Legionella pneumophila]CZH40177.1 Protein kinase domain [Legionella pneumophila]
MNNTENLRIEKYNSISNTLACMSNKQLRHALSDSTARHQGIGGSSVEIEVDNVPIFVKKVPISDFELKPDNYMSTANIFNLPMCYQYGIGSAGFGAWRELAAHIMTTNWVITRKCPNFPIMYHWRIIPDSISKEDLSYWDSQENYFATWENNQQIKFRIDSLNQANTSVMLFLEHFPKNLYQHLNEILTTNKSNNDASKHLNRISSSFENALDFMKANNFLHMDAHFWNVLADDEHIYLSDFGLALSETFDLSTSEKHFFEDHKNYDRYSFSVNLLHGVLTSYLGNTNWDQTLNDYLNNKLNADMPNAVKILLSKHAAVAEEMHTFYREIQKDKSSPYPTHKLDKLLEQQRGYL